MSASGVLVLCILCLSQLSDSAEEPEDVRDTENDIEEEEKTNNTETKMVGKIVGGALTTMDKNPHAAYLAIKCKMPKQTKRFGCGSSILNQDILITAAHCMVHCSKKSIIAIATASENKYKGLNNNGKHFLLHPKFDASSLSFDIALVKVKYKLKFGPRIKRIILMRHPPKIVVATLAGWGLVDETKKTSSTFLKMATQKILSKEECNRTIKHMPVGTICARSTHKNAKLYGYAAKGDSGSGLIGDDYILRGIVSYKNPKLATSVIVYTDASFFFDWTLQSAKQLMCMK